MRTLRDFDFKGKRVLVRCDFNVPLDENGNVWVNGANECGQLGLGDTNDRDTFEKVNDLYV